jgi:hypothetical protein
MFDVKLVLETAFALQQAEQVTAVGEVIRKMGISEQTARVPSGLVRCALGYFPENFQPAGPQDGRQPRDQRLYAPGP